MGSCLSCFQSECTEPRNARSTLRNYDLSVVDSETSAKRLRDLETVNPQNAQKFEIRGYRLARVVDVYDGDTITVFMHGPGGTGPYLWKVRLSGIDSPEIRSKNYVEKTHAYACREFLRRRIMNNIVLLECKGADKYGRLLATVYIERFRRRQSAEKCENVCKMMVKETPTREYDGRAKEAFVDIPAAETFSQAYAMAFSEGLRLIHEAANR